MIYVASSWRNPRFEGILDCLQQWNIAYYNWRDEDGFHWSDVMTPNEDVEHWTEPIPAEQYAQAMKHPRAQAGFKRDMDHLREAEALILLLECGKSAHLEAGWAVGAGKPVALYTTGPLQPELMYGMFSLITSDVDALMKWASLNTTERIHEDFNSWSVVDRWWTDEPSRREFKVLKPPGREAVTYVRTFPGEWGEYKP